MHALITRCLSPWARFFAVLALFLALGVVGKMHAPNLSAAGATANVKLGALAGAGADKSTAD